MCWGVGCGRKVEELDCKYKNFVNKAAKVLEQASRNVPCGSWEILLGVICCQIFNV